MAQHAIIPQLSQRNIFFFGEYCDCTLFCVFFFSKTEICVPHVLSVHLCPLRGEEQDFALAAE